MAMTLKKYKFHYLILNFEPEQFDTARIKI